MPQTFGFVGAFDSNNAVGAAGTVSFAGTSESLVIDLAASEYSVAATILAIGDSLTVGFVDVNDPSEVPGQRDGYRKDLFDDILSKGGWFDYVGQIESGPDDMIDQDHSAIGGVPLRHIVANNGIAGRADLSENLNALTPDIVLLMAGTNDFNQEDSAFFSNRLPTIVSNMGKAIDQFLAMDGSEDSYLVISTLAPKLRGGAREELADFINEGYSTVGGNPVVGDADNGTFVPGLRDLVSDRAATNPNILLFENPVDASGITSDKVHFSNAAYAEYAADMADFLEAEIGLTAGTLGGNAQFMAQTTSVLGGDAGDRIDGSSAADTIDGGGGADYIDGKGGADTIVFGGDTLTGTIDLVAGFSVGEGDRIDLSRMANDLGLSDAQMMAALTLSDTGSGVRLSVTTGGDTIPFAKVLGVTASALLPAISAISGPPAPSGDDDGNLALAVADVSIDETEVTAVEFAVSGLDADATAIVTVSDGSNNVASSILSADGTVTLDLSGLSDGALTSSVTATDAGGATATVSGADLALGTAPDTSADEDGNLLLSASNLLIDASEIGAVIFSVGGLDSDASAVVSVSDGTDTVTSDQLTADGSVVLDLSGLSDGTLTTSVTATDDLNNTATVSGPGVTLDTVTLPSSGPTVTGAAGNDRLNGLDGENTVILGLGGIDTLTGKGGEDTLIGGGDPDILRGGAGADVFVMDAAALASPGDDIKDFSVAQGDQIEFRDVLAGFDGTDIDGHVRIVKSGTLGRLEVDADGGGDDWTSLAVIRNGRFLDAAQLFADGNLLVTDGGTEIGGDDDEEDDDPVSDTSADEDGNLNIFAADLEIDADEATQVSLIVTGIDADADAVVEVTDGASTVTSDTLDNDGTVVLDLSGLATGPLSMSVVATDPLGNVATVAGIDLNLAGPTDPGPDPAPDPDPSPDPEDGVTGGAGDDRLRGVSGENTLILGLDGRDSLVGRDGDDVLIGGLQADALTGGTGADVFVMDADAVASPGDDIKDFSTAQGDMIEFRDVLTGFDGADIDGHVRIVKSGSIGLLEVDANGGGDSWTSLAIIRNGRSLDAADLLASGHLSVTGGDAVLPEPPTLPDATDGGSDLRLTAPALSIDATEATSVAFSVGGIDVGSFAVVTVSDGAAAVTSGALAADGTVTLDLSGLASGFVISSVTSTDSAGLTATAAGPEIELDQSADVDGNLALSASDPNIDISEVASVTLGLSGLDTDATALVTVGDGVTSVISSTLTGNGSVTFDLTVLADGPLTTSVTASDNDGNTVVVSGSGLTLDTISPPAPDIVATGTADNDKLRANFGENTVILGLDGRDTLFGRDGDDVLIGGADADAMTGGAGADTFVFESTALTSPGDDLKDFDVSDGDILEFRAILAGFNGQDLSGHVRIEKSGSLGLLAVDADGGGDDWTELAIIRNGRSLDAETLYQDGNLLITG